MSAYGYESAFHYALPRKIIVQLYDAPDASAEKAVEFCWVLLIDRNSLQSQIGEFSHITVMLDIQIYRDHINDSVAASLAKHRKDLLSFIRTHKIISKNPFDILYSLFNDLWIIGRAVLA